MSSAQLHPEKPRFPLRKAQRESPGGPPKKRTPTWGGEIKKGSPSEKEGTSREPHKLPCEKKGGRSEIETLTRKSQKRRNLCPF